MEHLIEAIQRIRMNVKNLNAEEKDPPVWVANPAIWEKAVKAVEPKWDDYDEPYAVVTEVYKNMGGKIK